MSDFILALALFLAAHVLPVRTGIKDWLVTRFGRGPYLAGYSLVSLGLLAWIIAAAIRAPVIPLWSVTVDHYWIALILMLPASILFVGGVLMPNPLSIGFVSAGFDPSRPGLAGVTRHPLLWGFALWAIAHIPANGELVPLIMFGGFGIFATFGMLIVDRRKQRQLGDDWSRLADSTAIWPFKAWFAHSAARRWRASEAVITLFGGIAFYLLLLWLHPRLIGPDPRAVLL
jgi:uncharacterized membrane protein